MSNYSVLSYIKYITDENKSSHLAEINKRRHLIFLKKEIQNIVQPFIFETASRPTMDAIKHRLEASGLLDSVEVEYEYSTGRVLINVTTKINNQYTNFTITF